MAWSVPMTAVSNATFTAAQFNASVRDNLLETAPAKATTAGRIFVATGANAIAERAIASNVVTTNENTAVTSFTDLSTVGPAVTVTTGANALVIITSLVANNTLAGYALASYAVSGATTIAATQAKAIWLRTGAANQSMRASVTHMETALTPGSNTFTMKYEASGAGTASFEERRIVVMGL